MVIIIVVYFPNVRHIVILSKIFVKNDTIQACVKLIKMKTKVITHRTVVINTLSAVIGDTCHEQKIPGQQIDLSKHIEK